MNVLMVGVGANRVGGMWTVAETYIKNKSFNSEVNLKYVSTSTNGTKFIRLLAMFTGYCKFIFYLLTKKVDLVHIHMAEKGSTFRKGKIAKWGKFAHKKVIIHLHAGPFMAWYGTLSGLQKRKVCKIFSYADEVFVLGNYWKKELSSIINADKITVMYNGADCPPENRYNPEGKYIVYLGVMNKQKGIYDLLNAIKKIDSIIDKEIKVLLCGNDLEGNVKKIINSNNLNKRIDMPGWINKKQRLDIFKNTMLIVLPSYYEGLSMTIIEAMSYGIPVITTNISTMPELLGENGYMYLPGDINALCKLLCSLIKDKKERLRLSETGYSRAKKFFSTEVFINKTLNEYKKLLKKEQP